MTPREPSNLRLDQPAGHPEPGSARGGAASRGRALARGTAADVLALATTSRGRRLAIISAAAVLAVATAIVAIVSTSSAAARPHADPHAPAFTLTLLGHSGSGSSAHISLAGLAGRPVIINFFASWCAPCQKETPLLARFFRAEHGKVTLIGVDANDKSSAALKFTRAAGVSYPVGFDPYPMHTTLSYGVAGLPQTFFLNAQHRIVKRIFGAVTEQELKAGVTLMNKRG